MAGKPKEFALAAALVAVVVAAALLIAYALIGGDATESAPENQPEQEEPEQPTAPLTGRVLEDEQELDHPAVAIKVSDVRQAHPQAGVDQADIVFAELLGVNYTRLAAVFHSDLPDSVGPVRSIRPADAPLLGPMAPAFGNTMASEWVMDYVYDSAELDDLGTQRVTGTGAYSIDSGRPQPDHVFADPNELLELSDFDDPPEPYFSYARADEPSSAARADEAGDGVEVSYGPDSPVTWTYDEAEGHYLRENPGGAHVMTDGTQISADNVVVIQVPSEMGKIGDGGGQEVPIADLVDGSGTFVALSEGHSVTGTWSKGDENDPFELRTDAGEPLELTPGNTWVELPEPSREVSTG